MAKWILIIPLFILTVRCQKPYGFTLQKLYSRYQFDGKELSGHSITVGPLLTEHGPCTTGNLRSSNQIKSIKQARSDLHLVPFSEFENHFRHNRSSDELQKFYTHLFRKDILALQTADSVWKTIKSSYFMAIRLNNGMVVKDFGRNIRKRLRIEGELWDKNAMEVVWRMSVAGISNGTSLPDNAFLSKAIQQLFIALPGSIPNYEEGEW